MNKQSLYQSLILLSINIKSLKHRWMRSLATVIGIVGVILVLVSLLAIAQGYKQVMSVTQQSGNTIIFMKGADSELVSSLTREQANIIKQLPGISRDDQNNPIVSNEVLTITSVQSSAQSGPMNISLRGVGEDAFILRENLQIIQGRKFQEGAREIIVGEKALTRFIGLQVGEAYKLGNTTWKIVGVFSAQGSVIESEMWTSVDDLQSAQQRGDSYQTLYTRLNADTTPARFTENANRDLRLNINAVSEEEYYSKQSEDLESFVKGLGYIISILMALGATFAAVNANYSNIITRLRELATYKAIGFKDSAIMSSIIAESLILAGIALIIGAGFAYLIFDGYTTSTLFMSRNHSQVVFSFDVTFGALLQAGAIAALIGIIGGYLPAWHANKKPTSQVLASRK